MPLGVRAWNKETTLLGPAKATYQPQALQASRWAGGLKRPVGFPPGGRLFSYRKYQDVCIGSASPAKGPGSGEGRCGLNGPWGLQGRRMVSAET